MHFHRSLLPSGLPPKASVQLYEHSVPSGTCLRIAYTSAISTRDSLCGGGGVLAGGRREHLYKNGQNRLRWRIDDCVIAKAQLP